MATDNPTQLLTIAKGKILSDKPTTKDSLHYSDYVDILADAIRTCETPMTIGIHGEWGSGKTSLMLMLRDRLEDEGLRTIWFNAWKYDKEGSLWRALILRILADLSVDEDDEEFERTQRELYATVSTEEFGRVQLDWAELGRAAAGGAAKAVLNLTLPVPISQAVTLLRQIGSSFALDENVDALGKAIDRQMIRVTQQRMSAIDEFERKYKKLIEKTVGQEGRLVVLIDDLDRCLPAKALEIFETLKTFLDAESCIYVVGCDRELVQKGLTEKYGGELDIDVQDYMEKIIQLPFDLPPLRDEDISNYISELGLPKQVEESVSIIVSGMEKNPRKMKRFLNSLSLQRALNEKRKLGLREEILIKTNCIAYRWRGFWGEAARNPAILGELEGIALAEELTEKLKVRLEESQILQECYSDSALISFLRARPHLQDVDLHDYIFLMKTFETEKRPGFGEKGRVRVPNPYIAGPPIGGDEGFYGRQDVFDLIRKTFASTHQKVIVLFGQRRVGKTSILYQLQKPPNLPEGFHPVYFNLEGRASQNLDEVLYALAEKIAETLNLPSVAQSEFQSDGDYFSKRFLPQAYEALQDQRLLLLFDEFDVLSEELLDGTMALNTFFPYLQNRLFNEERLAYIFVVGRRLEELTSEFLATFKQARTLPISFLSEEDARRLIREPMLGVVEYDNDAIGRIISLTACHPYLMQLVCFELVDYLDSLGKTKVTVDDVNAAVDDAIESGGSGLAWLWDGLPIAERFILSAVSSVADENGIATKESINEALHRHRVQLLGVELTRAPDALVNWGWLERTEKRDGYKFVAELLRRWIGKKHPLENAKQELQSISKRAISDYTYAQQAHIDGDLEMAVESYRCALAANPYHAGAHLGLAQALHKQGLIEEAVTEYEKAYNLDEMARERLVKALITFGETLEKEGRSEESASQYKRVLELSPENRDARERLARLKGAEK
jgi:tetratricopeptide (TPR) repeat protein